MNSSLRSLVLRALFLMVVSSSLLTGCGGRKIVQEYSLVHDRALSTLRASQTIRIEKGVQPTQKFHAALRISEGFLNEAAAKLLEAEIVPSRFESPVQVTVPVVGTQLTFRPGISVKNPRLVFTGSCPECVRLSMHVVGQLALDVNLTKGSSASRMFDRAPLSGDVVLKGRLIPLYTGGLPSLGLQLDPIEDGDLTIETNVPVTGLDTILSSAVRRQVRSALAVPRNNTFPLLPLRSLVIPGSRVTVDQLNFTLLNQPEGELFLGVLLNLTTPPELELATRGRRLRGDHFAVLMGQNTFTDLMRIWMAEGLIPGRFDYEGNASPEGPVAVELVGMSLFEDRYEARSRMWHLGRPPFWRDYVLTGTMAIRSEALTLQNTGARLVAKAGPNRLIDLALKLQKTSLKAALEGLESRFPRQIGFPFGEPARLTAAIVAEELQTDGQRFSLFGRIEFQPIAPLPPPQTRSPAVPVAPSPRK